MSQVPLTTHHSPPRRRRGVVLLVALGILIIFALAVVMFVISARQHKTAARAHQRVERYDDNFEGKLDSALMFLLRGAHNASCPIAPHSLLEDMYGSDGLPASSSDAPLTVSAAAPITATLSSGSSVTSGLLLITVQDALSRLNQQNGYYNGRVLTVLDGSARMQCTRIVGYNYANGIGSFQVLAFANGAVPAQNDPILINGREFNGTGFGYDPNTGATTHLDSDFGLPAAFFPNAAAQYSPRPATYPDPAGLGGADEGSDVPDFNNMHMAGRFWLADHPSIPPSLRGRWAVLLPSFHRPDLANYFAKHQSPNVRALATDPSAGSNGGQPAAFQRKYILRPLRNLHPPTANPSRPGFNYETDADTLKFINPDANDNGILDMLEANSSGLIWDVDNDGDGLVDSVWLDLGMPAETAPDGRRYKPLFAFLVLDMDGRLNLNTHSGDTQLTVAGPTVVNNQPFAGGANPVTPAFLPPGQGNSPVAINLRGILSQAELEQLLFGVAGTGRESPASGRYGECGLPASAAGKTDGQRDPKDIVNHPEYPGGYGLPFQNLVATSAGGVDQPVDFSEKSLFGLDKHGQPLRMFMGPGLAIGPQRAPRRRE